MAKTFTQLNSIIRGCFFAAAIGDALGSPFKNLDSGYVATQWDRRCYFTSALTTGFTAGHFADDSILSLATSNALIAQQGFDPQVCADFFRHAFHQGIPGLDHVTALALKNMQLGRPWWLCGIPGSLSTGNGPAMRIAPLGLFHGLLATRNLKTQVNQCAFLTHRNRTASQGAYLIAKTLVHLCHGCAPNQLLPRLLSELPFWSCFKQRLLRVQACLEKKPDQADLVKTLGNSACALDTVAMALYCFLSASSLEQSIVKGVLSGGATDTIASIAGALAGVYWGYEALPVYWLKKINHFSEINTTAENFLQMIAILQTI